MVLLIVWAWLKKYWVWLLFPVGLVLLLVGRLTAKKSVTVVNPELVSAAKERQKAQELEDAERDKAAQERADQLAGIEKEHARTIKQLTDAQKEKVDELRDDPEKLNSYLISVGKDIRG